MICPQCEHEYAEGIKMCPDCGSALIPQDEFSGSLSHMEGWVIVYTCFERYEAEMMKTNLESAGIETFILEQSDKSFPAYGDLTMVKLLVKKEDSADALEFINSLNFDFPTDEEI